MVANASHLLRREQLLALIIEGLARDGRSPSVRELARALGISCTRVRQLIDQLVREGRLERRAGAQRGLIVRDVVGGRDLLKNVLRRLGWADEQVIDGLGCPLEQLPRLGALEHLPDVDWPEIA